MNQSVLQNWLVNLPIRMQSTLVLGLRGPDDRACPEIKKITRWLRGLTFKPGNLENIKVFMGDRPPRIVEKGATAKELEFCSQHFYSHLMHALEVVGFRHPNEATALHAYCLFQDMCTLMHLQPETYSAFEHRLRHLPWPGDSEQPDTFEEALRIMEAHA